MTPSSTRASTRSARQTAYCPPRKNPFVPSIGSNVQNPKKKNIHDHDHYHGEKHQGLVEEERRTSCTPSGVFAPVDGLQERLGAPPPSKTPFCPFASSIAIPIDTARIGRRRGKRGLRQDVVCEFDDARAECCSSSSSSCVAGVGRRSAQVRGVFFAYDGVVRKGVREDGVDDRLRGIIGHFVMRRGSGDDQDQGWTFRSRGCVRVCYGVPVTGLLSPLTSVSPATSLLKTVMVSAHARRTAAMATCCSRANGTGMGSVIDVKRIRDNEARHSCAEQKKGFYHANTIMRSQPNASPPSLSLSISSLQTKIRRHDLRKQTNEGGNSDV